MNIHSPRAATSGRPHLLMCPPRHFAVTYSINPWMDPQSWADRGGNLRGKAQHQWADLRDALTAAGALVETIDPTPELPDLVFTANAAVVLDRKVVLSRFRYPERQKEEAIFVAAFATLRKRGVVDDVCQLPPGIILEGAGDCIWDALRVSLRCRGRFLSDATARPARCSAAAGAIAVLSLGHGAVCAALRHPHVPSRGVHPGRAGDD